MDTAELASEIERLHPASFGWALACCGRRRDEAEDVLQTTYLKILSGRARFDGRASFKTWLFAVIRRTAGERARQRFLSLFRLERLRLVGNSVEPETPATEIERSEAAERLMMALRRLARRQREVIELVFYHDMTVEEAARTMGVSVGTARVHYDRGKKRLRRELGAGS